MKMKNFIDYLFQKYKEDKEFGSFVKETDLINTLLQNLRRKDQIPSKITEKVVFDKISSKNEETTGEEPPISDSDGFSKILYEDLKRKRALSENQVSQEYLLNKNEIKSIFSHLSENFNKVRLYQGDIWVLEYTGGL